MDIWQQTFDAFLGVPSFLEHRVHRVNHLLHAFRQFLHIVVASCVGSHEPWMRLMSFTEPPSATG